MGNTAPRTSVTENGYIRDLNPANKDPRVKVRNEMMTRVIKKINSGEYLGESKNKIEPWSIYIDVLPGGMLEYSETNNHNYESTQRIFNLNEDTKLASDDTMASTSLLKSEDLVIDKDRSFSHSTNKPYTTEKGILFINISS